MSAPQQAVFRLPATALFIPIGLFVFATPLAAASVWTLPLYLLPLYGLFWVLITRTVADDRTIDAHLPLRTRRIPWADLDGFEFQGPRWAIAVTLDGRRIRLPMVRPRDLRRLAEVSGGRLYLGDDAAAQAERAADESAALTRLKAGAASAGAEPADGPDPVGDVPSSPVSPGGGPAPAADSGSPSASAGDEKPPAEAQITTAPGPGQGPNSEDADRGMPRAE